MTLSEQDQDAVQEAWERYHQRYAELLRAAVGGRGAEARHTLIDARAAVERAILQRTEERIAKADALYEAASAAANHLMLVSVIDRAVARKLDIALDAYRGD